jgi:hypothetical protein
MKTLITCLALAIALQAAAQKHHDDAEQKIYFGDQAIEFNEASVNIEDAVLKGTSMKMKIRIQNKTAAFILYNPSRTIIKYAGQSFNPPEDASPDHNKYVVVKPFAQESRVIEVMIPLMADRPANFELLLDGLSHLSTQGVLLAAPDFKLPASKNDLQAGNAFICNLTKVVKETKVTSAAFECRYTGTATGLLQPSKAVVRLAGVAEYANDNKDPDISVMAPGKSESFRLVFKVPQKAGDMATADMNIVWKETFREAHALPIPMQMLTFTQDASKNEEK